MKQTYYSIRTVVASTENKAIKMVEDGDFSEADPICDKVVTKEELIRILTGKPEPTNWVVEIPDDIQNKLTSTRDGMLATNHIKGKVLICVYDRGTAIKKARLFGGKAKQYKGKLSNRKHYNGYR